MENIKYFLFSTAQLKFKKEINKKIGKEYIPGTVFVGSDTKQFTDIVSDPKKSKYSDAIIVASGDINRINYKMGSD